MYHYQSKGGADVPNLHWQASEASLLVPVPCHLNQPQTVVCPQAYPLELLTVCWEPIRLDRLLVCLCWGLEGATCYLSCSAGVEWE